jgi:rhomboid protease GluP
MHPVRIAATSGEADEWALVLTAADIPSVVTPDAGGWAVLVSGPDVARAQAALAAYDDDRRGEPAPATVSPAPYPWVSGVAVGLLLLWFFTVTGPAAAGSRWVERGAAVAGRLVAGEVWRAVTALTLHADIVHASGNAVAVAVLLPPIVERFGAGAALGLLLLAGAAGNVLAAAAHDARHVAVGASTAVFGAVGILVALRLLPGTATVRRGKRWTAPVAGVLLLVLLGTARDADLTAHALGLVAGLGLGLVAGAAVPGRPRSPVQWLLGLLAAAVLAGCWAAALRA